MKIRNLYVILLLLLAVGFCPTAKAQGLFDVKTVVGFPSGEVGYGLGVSACYAGMIGDRLVVAGGCNFPEPGKKKYYSGIYAAKASADTLHWQLVGYLPEPAAYGGVVASGDSLIFIGGNNQEHRLKTVMSVRLNERKDKAIIRSLPSLPFTVDNMAVTLCDGEAYVVGGNQNGKPSASLLRWKVNEEKGWERLSPIPGNPRVQPICVAHQGGLYVWGGFFADGLQSTVATDGYRYDVASDTWKKLDAPRDVDGKQVTLTGGTAILHGQSFLCLGGVNKDIFWDAISGSYRLVKKEDYLLKEVAWYRFNGYPLSFDPIKGRWNDCTPCDSRYSRAGAQLVAWGDKLYYIGGEVKPSVRTPEILLLLPK